MTYQCNISSRAQRSFRDCLNYLVDQVGGTGNSQAAANFVRSFDETLKRVSLAPYSYAICEHPRLSAICIRKAHFVRMHYKILFHVEDDIITVDFVCHDLQDYENLFGD